MDLTTDRVSFLSPLQTIHLSHTSVRPRRSKRSELRVTTGRSIRIEVDGNLQTLTVQESEETRKCAKKEDVILVRKDKVSYKSFEV